MRLANTAVRFFRSYFVESCCFAAVVSAQDPALSSNSLGTLLIYPKFDIRDTSRTEFKVVNYSDEELTFHYNYVCPGVPFGDNRCRKLDRTIKLTPHETRVIDVALQHPPCNQGFILGYPVNENGDAISNNFLSGSYDIFSGRRRDSDNVVAIESVKPTGTLLGSGGVFQFTPGPNQDFLPIPTVLVSDFRAVNNLSELPSGSRLILLDIGAALGMQNPISSAMIDFWSASEEPFSSSVQFICWTELNLHQMNPNFLEENLGTTFGSFKTETLETCPVAGACPPYLPRAPLMLGGSRIFNPSALRSLHAVPPTPTPAPAPTNHSDNSANRN